MILSAAMFFNFPEIFNTFVTSPSVDIGSLGDLTSVEFLALLGLFDTFGNIFVGK